MGAHTGHSAAEADIVGSLILVEVTSCAGGGPVRNVLPGTAFVNSGVVAHEGEVIVFGGLGIHPVGGLFVGGGVLPVFHIFEGLPVTIEIVLVVGSAIVAASVVLEVGDG